ncbi:HET-domain-containing protein [Staphylotrichum tortipilum]|uniref:HET-domain-containing protein n=1 Tax=Staphylotrichum tortipilum TaxID=2831512 RepID=A0AAN6RP05_9PEZI|nr:HET-domain-containing protein [Staphylotrichum longicolle]
MPTRTLRLDPATGSLRLQPSSSAVEPYAALTYCWGGDQPQKLTRSNQQDYESGIDIQRLPATIQDALRVAGELGIFHVWIDSLCIVQDDFESLATEIAKMPQVYGHAVVTISVSRTSRAADGFLADIDPRELLTEPFRLRYECPNGIIGSIYVVGVPDKNSLFSDLCRRGWTLQERCLSPRLLDYGKLQMRWMCDSSKNRAWTVNGWDPDEKWPSGNYDVMREVKAKIRSAGDGDIAAEKTWLLAKWRHLVEVYADRDLTVTTDRILAISALAQEFGDMLDEEYLAGLWRCTLPCELLWCQASGFRDGGGAGASPRPERYQGPSWSWVAVNGPVLFLGELSAPTSAAVTHVEVRASESAANMARSIK